MPIQELWRTMGEIQARMQAKLNILQLKVNELHREIGEDTEVLAEWQTAYLVICGVFSLIYHTILPDHQQHSTCTHGILCQRPTLPSTTFGLVCRISSFPSSEYWSAFPCLKFLSCPVLGRAREKFHPVHTYIHCKIDESMLGYAKNLHPVASCSPIHPKW